MMKIKHDGERIIMHGHAGNKTCCAMMTALCDALMSNIKLRLREDPSYTLHTGYFMLDTHGLGIEASLLVDAFWFAVRKLAESYPMNFEITQDETL